MNKVTRKKDLMVPEVTTGPIAGSAKVIRQAAPAAATRAAQCRCSGDPGSPERRDDAGGDPVVKLDPADLRERGSACAGGSGRYWYAFAATDAG